ncbi:hypothetical protein ACFQPG_10910 [Sphingomonas sp. GCM10030256]|uniref:hypothetical protein n=1 Tax=Sphingomonas sp. GCM10030256 TaxID=3273427 RepID=UPI00360F1223
MPFPGQRAKLMRAGLVANGIVVWASDGRCGFRFDGLVNVKQWLASTRNVEQRRVDQIVQLVKSGAVPLPFGSAAPSQQEAGRETGVADELASGLAQASTLLQLLADELADDEEVIKRHALRLQNVDIVLQIMGALGSLLRSGMDGESETMTKLRDLRRSAIQSLSEQS